MRTALSVLAPAIVLVAVVAFAWPGPSDDGQRAALPAPPAATASASPPSASFPAPSADGIGTAAASLPAYVFGLPVRAIGSLRLSRAEGEVGHGLIAVAGYLTADSALPACSGRGDAASVARCTRFAVLSAEPEYRRDVAPSHIHLQILPGTDVPVDVPPSGHERSPDRDPVQIILIGRYGAERAIPCAPGGRRCNQEFVLERIAWANGSFVSRTVVRDPALAPGDLVDDGLVERFIALREADRTEIILSQAVVGLRLLQAIDPVAAAVLPLDAEGPFWYQRSMARPGVGDGERLVSWVVIDDATGFILAVGPPAAM